MVDGDGRARPNRPPTLVGGLVVVVAMVCAALFVGPASPGFGAQGLPGPSPGTAPIASPGTAPVASPDAGLPPLTGVEPAPGDPGTASDRVIVRLDPTASGDTVQVATVATDLAARVDGVVASVGDRSFVVEVPADSAREAGASLLTHPAVASVAGDPVFSITATPNDPCFLGCPQGRQSNLDRVRARAAWNITQGSSSIEVAVLDTGVAGVNALGPTEHPDLVGKVTDGGTWDPGPICGPGVIDHGTHVAGAIAANTDNGLGIAGLGWNTRVVSYKVLNSDGCGLGSTIANGVTAAANRSTVRVINLSLGGSLFSQDLADAVAYARSQGKLVVAAAGNSGSATPTFPGAFPGVLAVGATRADDGLASFSNRGLWVDIAAPGVGILSTYFGGYVSLDGTSFAAPLVAATAALVFAQNPSWNGDQVAQRIVEQADWIPGTGTFYERGMLDAAGALAPGADGFWVTAADGGVFAYGSAAFYGSAGALPLQDPMVGMAVQPAGQGYWLVAADGGIFGFGGAGFFGSTGSIRLNRPIVGMAPTPSGNGYWLVASDGGIFSFGDAVFRGSTGAMTLNRPIVGMAATPSGNGYWLVASDGGIFSFGDAPFYGSTGSIALTQPVVGMARTPSGQGYWFVASDGGVFTFGDAAFQGSTGGAALAAPVRAMAATNTGTGYWLVGEDGEVYSFGDAPTYGSSPSGIHGAVAIAPR